MDFSRSAASCGAMRGKKRVKIPPERVVKNEVFHFKTVSKNLFRFQCGKYTLFCTFARFFRQ